ncbi:pentatricopeptide repeat-containing protein [Rosa sericea]
MSVFLRRSKFSQQYPLFLRRHSQSDVYLHRRYRSAAEMGRSPGGQQKRGRGEQGFRPTGGSLPLPGLLNSPPHSNLHCPHAQIPFLLPHPTSLFTLQEKMLASSSSIISSFSISIKPVGLLLPNRGYFHSSVTVGGEEEEDRGVENEDVSVSSGADPEEVDRVCKVIDELFALDRNMEAVLDQCGVQLSHDLVVAVLRRFHHARKPAFRFFCWAGEKPDFEHDSRTYNSMMSILGKTRQFETMVSLLEEMGVKGLLTMETFVIAFKAFAAAKERKKAVGIFELMKYYKFKYGVDTVNCLLDTLGRAKLGKEMQVLFDKLKGRFTPNVQTYAVLLDGWCRVKNLMEAGRVWNEMIDEGFKPDIVTHNIMLGGLLRSHKRSDAIKLFEIMKAKGPSPNVRTYSILIQNFCKQKQMKEAIHLFDEMRESGCQPSVVVYTSLITGFGNQNKMDMVHGLLKAMKQDGCTPDGVTYNSLIKLMTRQRMPDDAVRIYKKMIQNGVEPSIHTYVMIMKSYFQTRNYDMGRAVWDEMTEKGCCPDDNAYTVLIGGLICQGRTGEACKYLEEMIEKGMKIPQLDFNKFAADFSKAGKPDILVEMAQKMKLAGKFELSNVFARWAEMTKKKMKGRDPDKTSDQGIYFTSHGSIHDTRS